VLNTGTLTDKLISEYTHNYIGKLFYFCLKKTGNTHEAEDLTSDISLNIIAELQKGIIPASFSAWIWRIARNRYSAWADSKHRRNTSVSGADINSLELADEKALIEDNFIHIDELKLLRRELAFITSDYRKIVVAYYIDDMSVKDIANLLGLPEGTVKTRLFRSRNILKEGMSMAREFGVMSYKPENIGFIMNGICGRSGEPWSIMNRNLCKNILLAAYRTPSSAKELSIELGVALPYMEDELNVLTKATLLKKNGEKYETYIFIVSAQAQEKIYMKERKIAPELTSAIIALHEYQIKYFEDNSSQWHEGYQPYEDMKWALLMRMVDKVHFGVLDEINKNVSETYKQNVGRLGHTLRPDGGEWDLLGLEDYKGDRPEFVGLHGCIDTPDFSDYINFGQFKFNYKRICDKTPVHLNYEEGKALLAVAKGDVSTIPEVVLERLVSCGYLKKDGNNYHPTFCVMFFNKIKDLSQEQEVELNRLFDAAKKIALTHYQFCRNIIFEEIPNFLKDDQYQIEHACANIYEMRGAVLEEALKTGYITYSDNDSRNMLGAYLIID
jgi:RNA polymerase sigma factor (sigma-70 family)